MANGMKGRVDPGIFENALKFGCIEMTKLLARDGEGATKIITTEVKNAYSDEEARFIAKALVNSPLIKTMAYGADPNIGRVLMAVGKCFDKKVEPDKIEVTINGTLVYKDYTRVDFDEVKVRKLLSDESVHILVNLNIGSSHATAFGCDLTEGYIKENAAYYSS
jgi:glutamate N-acetyltransferase/amino-acid N-acetyltransferase